MKLTRYISFSAAMLVVAAFSSFAQTARPDFNRAQSFDVQHYTIRASFDRSNKKVFGDTTVSLKPMKGDFRVVELDAVDFTFESVKLDPSGLDLQYKTSSNMVIVTLDKAYGPGDVIAIRFKYTVSPKKGVYFVAAVNVNDQVNHSDQIWSQGEADEARHWFPSFDFPSDKATTEEYLTVEKGETVVGNGEFLGKSDNPNGTETWHYNMPIPHSTYLVSFVIGKYVRVDDRYKEIPLGFYVYPGKEATARKAFGDTKNMIGVYENLTGVAFPYNKYDQTVVASFQFGGMENITATTMADQEIFFADFDFGKSIVTDLVSHELAHSWFGDLVTCRNWAELWLNEGFATYMEAAYREKAFGREDYIRKVRSDAAEFLADDAISRKRHGLFNRRAGDVGALFDNASTTYHKGGAVIHMLREQVGTEAFWKAINIYLNRHKFGSVESTDLKRAMEETSGQDLGWFFEQWVYDVGAPKLIVNPVYNSRTKTLKLTITQTQKFDAFTPPAFRLPVEVAVKTGRGVQTKAITISKRIETFSIPSLTKPSVITLDPDDKVVVKTVKMLPVTVVR
ncbi:MAG: M1 family metallopeptidase [Pyrinomonadaceae bacterium]